MYSFPGQPPHFPIYHHTKYARLHYCNIYVCVCMVFELIIIPYRFANDLIPDNWEAECGLSSSSSSSDDKTSSEFTCDVWYAKLCLWIVEHRGNRLAMHMGVNWMWVSQEVTSHIHILLLGTHVQKPKWWNCMVLTLSSLLCHKDSTS